MSDLVPKAAKRFRSMTWLRRLAFVLGMAGFVIAALLAADMAAAAPPVAVPIGSDIGSQRPRPRHVLLRHRFGQTSRPPRSEGSVTRPVDGRFRPEGVYQTDPSFLQSVADNLATGLTPETVLVRPVPASEVQLTRGQAVRRTLRTMFNQIDPDRIIDSLPTHGSRSTPESPPSSSGSGDGRARFRVGVSHLSPKVEMRSRMGGSALGLSISPLGQVDLELAHSRLAATQVHVGYDRDAGRYDLACRFAF